MSRGFHQKGSIWEVDKEKFLSRNRTKVERKERIKGEKKIKISVAISVHGQQEGGNAGD